MKGVIFNIERNSFVDGPGIRTTVFFKGCNLKCAWCHNPESQNHKAEIMFYRDKCIGCGKCSEICPSNMKNCVLCGKCCLYCPTDSRIICGETLSADEILKVLKKDVAFYESSGGGVTFSGGECMLQIEFLEELLRKCRENGIHTAVDTAGCVPYEYFERILPYTDLFLYDVKCITEKKHIEAVGVTNRKILDNLTRLSVASPQKIIIRVPLIPGFNCDSAEIRKIADFISTLDVKSVEILPYHRLGESKYKALNMPIPHFFVPSKEETEKYRKILTSAKLGKIY